MARPFGARLSVDSRLATVYRRPIPIPRPLSAPGPSRLKPIGWVEAVWPWPDEGGGYGRDRLCRPTAAQGDGVIVRLVPESSSLDVLPALSMLHPRKYLRLPTRQASRSAALIVPDLR